MSDDVKIKIAPIEATNDEEESSLDIVYEDGSLNMDFIEIVLNSALHQTGVMPLNYLLHVKEMVYEVHEVDGSNGTQLN